MLNVYDKFENPKELDGYEEKYPLVIALQKFKNAPSSLTTEERDILSKHPNAVARNPLLAYYYAMYIIKGRWHDGEQMIMKDPLASKYYAENIIKGRWEEAEPVLMKDPMIAYYYALDIIKGRWDKAEPYIMQSPKYAYEYAENVIKGRWAEAEPYIKQNNTWWRYYQNFMDKQE